MSIDKGMFNFQGIMEDFYGYKPGADDSEGRAQKNSFQANMVQSGFDASLAKDMAYAQSGIAKGNMTHAADLELRNKGALMNDEFNKGTLNMGAQFEFQNRFAEDQTVRNITENTTGSAVNFELGNKAAENESIRQTTQGSTERADTFEYANQGNENKTITDVTKDSYNQGAQFDYADKLADNQNIRDMAKIGFTGDENRKTLAATGTQQRLDYVVQGEQQRYGTMQTGDETRRTQNNADRLEAGKENRQSARARATARAF